jgi:hypothetical protein
MATFLLQQDREGLIRAAVVARVWGGGGICVLVVANDLLQ